LFDSLPAPSLFGSILGPVRVRGPLVAPGLYADLVVRHTSVERQPSALAYSSLHCVSFILLESCGLALHATHFGRTPLEISMKFQ